MPCLIEFIDAIARKKKRGVLYIGFSPETQSGSDGEEDVGPMFPSVEWKTPPVRQPVINWLDENEIAWKPCGHIADPSVMLSYQGQIYIDLPYAQDLPEYQKLAEFLENPDGSMRLPRVEFWYLPLEIALRNAHHDEPGFWAKWAESF